MKREFLILVAVSTVLMSCGGGKKQQVAAVVEAVEECPRVVLAERLAESVEAGKIMYGHQDDLVYGHSWVVEDVESDPLERSDVKAVCGKYPAVVGFDLGGIEMGDEKNLDSVSFELIRRAAVTHVSRGGIVTFSWHPRNPLTGGDAWDVSSDKVVSSILEGGEKHEEFLVWLSRLGDFFASLKDPDGKLIPVIFRPWHENIGSWFWWGGRLCTAGEYVELYRMTRRVLSEEKGLDNILWCYSPNSDIDATMYMSRYPGDDYVEILGTDAYATRVRGDMDDAAAAFIKGVMNSLTFMTTLADEHKKLMCLSETGFEGIPDDIWWTRALFPAISGFKIAYVLTWRNAHDKPTHYYAPWPGSPDADDFQQFTTIKKIALL